MTFIIFKANGLPSVARWYNGHYSLIYQVRSSPLGRNIHQKYYSLTLTHLKYMSSQLWAMVGLWKKKDREEQGREKQELPKSYRNSILAPKMLYHGKQQISLKHGPLHLSTPLCPQMGDRPSPRCWIQAVEGKTWSHSSCNWRAMLIDTPERGHLRACCRCLDWTQSKIEKSLKNSATRRTSSSNKPQLPLSLPRFRKSSKWWCSHRPPSEDLTVLSRFRSHLQRPYRYILKDDLH